MQASSASTGINQNEKESYLEVDRPQAASDHEGVALVDGPVRLQEVRLQEDFKPVSGQAFDGVIDRKDVDPLAVLDVRTFRDRDDVAETNSEVVSDDAVHPDLLAGDGVVAEDDADGLLPLLALQQDRVASEQAEFVHLGLRQSNNLKSKRLLFQDVLFNSELAYIRFANMRHNGT